MKKRFMTFAATLVFAAGMSFAQSGGSTGTSGSGSDQNSAASSGTSSTSSSDQSSTGSTGSSKKHKASKGDQGATSTGAADASSKMSKKDENFMMKAAQGGEAEVELGKLATQKAQNDQVKQFGQRMVDDHSKANQELQSLAGQKGVTLPTDMNKKDQAEKDRLSSLSGADFDKAYMQHMVQDHKKDVAEFERNSNNAKDSDLKNWAAKTLPTLQDHLKQAESTASAVGASTSASSKKKSKKEKGETSGQ